MIGPTPNPPAKDAQTAILGARRSASPIEIGKSTLKKRKRPVERRRLFDMGIMRLSSKVICRNALERE